MNWLVARKFWRARQIRVLGSNPVLKHLRLRVHDVPVGEQVRVLNGAVDAVRVEVDGVVAGGNPDLESIL
jgi:hypothetical protein